MVAITDRYRRHVEKRYDRRRVALLPMRVSTSTGAAFEGVTLEISDSGLYFRTSSWEAMQAGERVTVELSVPAELTGGPFALHRILDARVVRIDQDSLARRVGCRPHDCGVAVAFEREASGAAFKESMLEDAAVAVA